MCLKAIFFPSLRLCFYKRAVTGCLELAFWRGLYEIHGTRGHEKCHIQA